ncbi:glycosyltransferase [Rhodococcus sp. F64268]|uniref:glycosyltransferase family 2 protein n=1 Tax=Rhodococcus sp. F64268 TaxID=2926402 RepID=UPI001FF37582|nr:glycosyltransferase [Rhodococcus sp. F64268]MCK0090485.1 glycosyltransferase [Rhodococcus sp. F64268]
MMDAKKVAGVEVKKISVLMTTHNRVETTLQCLRTLDALVIPDGIEITPVVVDAGSIDGTLMRVQEEFPEATAVGVSKDIFWAQGMRTAWELAQKLDYDYILWLNDDVELYPDALTNLFAELSDAPGIAVGTVVDPDSKELTYSGFRQRSRMRPFKLELVDPRNSDGRCVTLNGNVVLVPASIDRSLGGFPDGYIHAMADLAFGFEATKMGIPIKLTGAPVGQCSRNETRGTWVDDKLEMRDRFTKVKGPKALPTAVWFRFCMRYGGVVGPLCFASPYLRILSAALSPSTVTTRIRTKMGYRHG